MTLKQLPLQHFILLPSKSICTKSILFVIICYIKVCAKRFGGAAIKG